MDELFQHLEKQIKDLIGKHHQLSQANQQLHHGRFSLAREKDLLLSKQQKAIHQIESLVARLKAIEAKQE